MGWQLTGAHRWEGTSQAQDSERGQVAVPLPVFQARGLVPSRLQVQNAKSRFGQREEVRVGPAWSLYTHPSIRACMSGSRASSFVRQHSNSV